MVKIKMNLKDLDNNGGMGGLEIEIPETLADPSGSETEHIPIFIEYYEGELRVCIWDNTQDPVIIPIKNLR